MQFREILFTVIVVYLLYRTILNYRSGVFTRQSTFVWVILWLTMLVVIFKSELLTYIAHLVGIGRGVDLAIYLSIIFLFYIVSRLLVSIYEINRKITHIVRQKALEDKLIHKKGKRRRLK